MFPVWVAMVFAALIAGYTVIEVQRADRVMAQAQASNAAMGFMAYRRGAQNFVRANPGHTGMIAHAALTAYFPAGYVNDGRWAAVVDAGRLFVFTVSAPPQQDLADSLWRESGRSPTVGLRHSSGRLFSYAGMDTGIALPPVIPVGAVVMYGN